MVYSYPEMCAAFFVVKVYFDIWKGCEQEPIPEQEKEDIYQQYDAAVVRALDIITTK